MRKFSNKKLAAMAVAAVALTGTGVAYAYWTTTGGGSGSAATADGAPNIDVTQTSSHPVLAPGIASQTVAGTIENNSTSAAGYVDTITVTVAQPYTLEDADSLPGTPDVPVDAVGCSPTDFGLVEGTTSAILARSGDQTITMDVETDLATAGSTGDSVAVPSFQLGFVNKTTEQDGCKSVIVPLSYATD